LKVYEKNRELTTIVFQCLDNEKRRRPEHHVRQAMLTPV
jgi:hypothetical protein